MKAKNAAFGKLSTQSWLRGLYYTLLTAILPMLVTVINSGTITLAQLKPIGLAALSVGFTYILTHLFTNSDNQMFTKENPTTTNPVQSE